MLERQRRAFSVRQQLERLEAAWRLDLTSARAQPGSRQFLGLVGAPPVIIHGVCAPGKDHGYNDPAHVDALLDQMQKTLQLIKPTAQLVVVVGCATSPSCLP